MNAAATALPRRLADAAETSSTLNSLTTVLRPLARALSGAPRVGSLLRGEALGHALHPPLTDVPIGLWLSSSVLDALGPDYGSSADRLLGLGILAAAPTALTGLADWQRGGDRVRRVGALHAALNSGALALYSTSWVLRRRGHRSAGVVSSLVAGAAVAASGYLGGHMVLVLHSPDEPDGEPVSGPPGGGTGRIDVES
ncbi:DUF2231 domain-containing protein [Cellulomonas sp. P5_C6]